ncbi:MAG: quinohemoprotein amine dehydrogenase subunit alpha [Pseudomonadales bacterium]|nr:quinohemoprotein amine dehydrogenase subunit alpha [Pseudomonadales bacterium]
MVLTLLSSFAFSIQAGSPEQIIRNNCVGCHIPESDDKLSRISYQRRTPEGWEMTIARMQLMHHVRISDQEIPISDEIIQKLVKYFADRQGLAPSESANYRYILERRLNVVEQHPDAEFAVMCARCHSGARVALQRRTEQEWRHLVHFHLGQFPTSEYSAGGRDRNWFEVALNNTVPYLAKHYPLKTQAWTEWQKVKKPQLEGSWRLIGNQPGKGDFQGVMTAIETEKDNYKLSVSGYYANGDSLTGEGSAIVYTGYEWRSTLTLDTQVFNQVMAANGHGDEMSGRMFLRDHEETGIQLSATKMDGKSRVLGVMPNHIKAGTEQTLRLVGTALAGDIVLAKGLMITDTVSRDSENILLKVKAAKDLAVGNTDIKVGNSRLMNGLVVYDQVSHLEVEPSYAVARVGDNGGATRKTLASFQAVGYSAGVDGKPGTEDDLRIGYLPAQWSVRAFNAQAEKDQDVHFAGKMNKNTGIFTPAAAGPNPKRKYSTNNAGNLAVIATVQQGDKSVTGTGQLLVTVQRWNNPPIR